MSAILPKKRNILMDSQFTPESRKALEWKNQVLQEVEVREGAKNKSTD